VLDHEQRGRHVIQLFADHLADAPALAVTAGTDQLRRLDGMLDAMTRQIRRQRPAAVTGARWSCPRKCLRECLFLLRCLRLFRRLSQGPGLGHPLTEQQELIRIDPLRSVAIHPAQQQVHAMGQLVLLAL